MKKYQNQNNVNITWIMTLIIIISGIIINIMFVFEIDNVNKKINALNEIEYVRAGTQRIIKQNIEDRGSEQISKDISNIVKRIDNTEEISSVIMEIYGSKVVLDEFVEDWYDIEDLLNKLAIENKENQEIQENQENKNKINLEELYFSGERHFYNSNELTIGLKYSIEDDIKKIRLFGSINVISIILLGIFNIKNFICLRVEINKNKEISTSMFVDTATGLYDRSRCQELFKEEQPQIEEKSRIVIIFDLNDLKKTNDTYGHKIGDELIETFAKILKDGTKIHQKEPFLGRYGGDEFVIYYDNEDKQEVNLYLQEIEKIRIEQNKKEKRYQISYAVGYAIADKSTGIKTFRELFDEADDNMYKNKKKMKELKELNKSKN